jgi:ATP-dependent Clp protease, protease subunit
MKCEENSDSFVILDESAREIFLFGQLDINAASKIISNVIQLDRASKSNISLVISSFRGDEGAGWTIYDALCLTRCKVVGKCYGECMSISVLLLQGCDLRLLAPNCRLMLHNGSVELENETLDDLNRLVKEEFFLTHRYYEELAKKSNLTVDQVKKLCDNSTYMSADTAVGYGFADSILKSRKTGDHNGSKKRQ